jgi:hypothetical protein
MKIILSVEDIKQLIFDSYNGVNDISVENDEVDFLLDVNGNVFHRITDNNRVELEQTPNPVTIPKAPIKKREPTKVNLAEPPDFDTLIYEKPLVDNGVHPPKEKTLDEQNEEAMKKGLMTRGRSSPRPVRKL